MIPGLCQEDYHTRPEWPFFALLGFTNAGSKNTSIYSTRVFAVLLQRTNISGHRMLLQCCGNGFIMLSMAVFVFVLLYPEGHTIEKSSSREERSNTIDFTDLA